MTAVIDASALVPYLLGEASGDERAAVLSRAHAPGLLDIEVTQTIRGLTKGAGLSVARGEQALADLDRLAVHRYPDRPLLRRAWELRDVCTVYDGLYVALAEALGATLVTRDARLARGVRGLVDVVI